MATATTLPRADRETAGLVEALRALGVPAAIHAWDAPPRLAPDWRAARMVLLRSTWNYAASVDAFETWLQQVGQRLANPLPLVRWNLRKSYLPALAARGVALPPTRLLPAGTAWSASDLGDEFGGEVVVKPVVGAGARGAMRAMRDDPALAAHVREWLGREDMLVQPFLPRIAEGERSLIHIGGAYSHAVLKLPRGDGWRVQGQHGGVAVAHAPTAAEHALAEAALAAAAATSGAAAPLYARVDMACGEAGPLLMELELIEPELFLGTAPGATERLARAVAARL